MNTFTIESNCSKSFSRIYDLGRSDKLLRVSITWPRYIIACVGKSRAVSVFKQEDGIIVIQTRPNKTLQIGLEVEVKNKYYLNLLAVSCAGRHQISQQNGSQKSWASECRTLTRY